MPEAVTTHHETLWIGVNRSAMVRVPYVVSSPEIAGPVQPIDATNLASDMRVYIPGIKDYSGDLTWEANSQYYRPGELRDLLAMDGCHVWAERRMPMVGVRVCIEGEASVSLSAADPDGVQRVTIRIAPSSPLAVEEWSGDTSDGYLYRIRTNNTGVNVQRVDVSYGGRPLSMVVASWTRAQGAANIPKEWAFNGGVGPFGCFYAAFNIDAYTAGTESEEPVCTEAGRLAYRLDPYDLGRTLAGTALTGTYNVMLVIPTVYWKVSSNDLLLSDRARYSSPSASASGMVPYAHTATLPGGGERTYPYIGIGVYEASSSGGVLLSASGKTPTVNLTHDQFKTMADALTSAGQSDFQQCTFSMWTLYKMMAYAVIGTKNGRWALGDGPVTGSNTRTGGQSARAGPYADSTSKYSKLFIENPWGSAMCGLGDAFTVGRTFHAGNSLGGAELADQESVGLDLPVSGFPTSVSNDAPTWDFPLATSESGSLSDPATTGSKITNSVMSAMASLGVGGSYAASTSAGLGYWYSQGVTAGRNTLGTRLSAFLDDYAVGLTDEAPASLSMSAPPALSMGQSAPESDGEEVADAEPGEDAGIAEESEETPEAEIIEEDMR